MAPMEERELTLMFYFASDQPLAPEIVTQLKAIKQAGFHPEANVVAQFDPNPENVETHIFDVNSVNKVLERGGSKRGFIGRTANDPFIVNLMTDKLWRKKGTNEEKEIRERVRQSVKESFKRRHNVELKDSEFDPPEPPPPPPPKDNQPYQQKGVVRRNPEAAPQKSLRDFLKFCSDNYPARHYMLFIVGHGVVVGNDTFLFDEHTDGGEHFLRLQTLGAELQTFKENIEKRNRQAKFELVSFHSCSMSSLEVAFELQGKANYMLASQSPSFVGSYPYRQILIGIFNYLERGDYAAAELRRMIKNIFHYCIYNSVDFLAAGYSFDGCLCDLRVVKQTMEEPVKNLSGKLIRALTSTNPGVRDLAKERVLLAHLDAQSYFNETHIDLFDFCFRLQQRIRLIPMETLPAELKDLSDACLTVMEALKRGVGDDDDRFIVRSEFIGPAYQYSHGMSIYFPWVKPKTDEFFPTEYDQYQFVKPLKEAGQTSWSNFLSTYFDATMRHTRMKEFELSKAPGFESESKAIETQSFQDRLLEDFAPRVFNSDGRLALSKGDPSSSQGDDCTCPSIKNYPPFMREPEDGQPVSQTLLNDKTFKPQPDEQDPAGPPALTFLPFDGLIG